VVAQDQRVRRANAGVSMPAPDPVVPCRMSTARRRCATVCMEAQLRQTLAAVKAEVAPRPSCLPSAQGNQRPDLDRVRELPRSTSPVGADELSWSIQVWPLITCAEGSSWSCATSVSQQRGLPELRLIHDSGRTLRRAGTHPARPRRGRAPACSHLVRRRTLWSWATLDASVTSSSWRTQSSR